MKSRYVVLIILLILLAPVAALDFFQEKPQTMYSADDFFTAGRKAHDAGDLQAALNNFDKAEELFDKQPDTHDKYLGMAGAEREKANIYNEQGNPEAAAEANRRADNFHAKGDLSPGACLIATATFDSPLAPQVQQLREFRENTIYSTRSGTQFMTAFNAWYYSFSPTVAGFIDDHPLTKPPMRVILTPLLGILSLSQSFYALSINPEIAVIITGFVAGTLIGMVYAFPVLFVLLFIIQKIHPFAFTTGVLTIFGGSAITGLVLLGYGGLLSVTPVLLVGSVLFIVSLVLLTGLFLSWVCMNRLDLRSAPENTE